MNRCSNKLFLLLVLVAVPTACGGNSSSSSSSDGTAGTAGSASGGASGATSDGSDAGGTGADGTGAGGTGAGGTDGSGTICPGDDHKRVLWGDLHVHTSYSYDAYTFNNLNDPADALAFARGGPAEYPCDDPGAACETRTLTLPLDFVAVTEHAEYLGVGPACGADGSVENVAFCTAFQQFILNNLDSLISATGTPPEFLGELIGDVDDSWARVQEATDAAYSPCQFTTLHAYEHSPVFNGSAIHRNVFFLGEDIPSTVVDSFDAPDEWSLFAQLDAACPPGSDGPDCEYFTIPHNSNLSDGRMFQSRITADGAAASQAQVEQRARADVLVEVYNHKGQAECQPGYASPLAGEEEACDFESFKPICDGSEQDPPNCRSECQSPATDANVSVPEDCTAPLDMTRATLVEGLRLASDYEGVNPYAFGFVGATDTHNGDPGSVEEASFNGHGGVLDNDPSELLGNWECPQADPDCAPELREWNPRTFHFNPGGLTGVWAQRNTREGVFGALKRREAFATSGARIETRLYAGWTLPDDLCDQLAGGAEGIDAAPLGAVPMGGMLVDPPGGAVPTFVINAVADPITGNPLQRIEVIKGWVDAEGKGHTRVVTVVGDTSGPSPSATCSMQMTNEPERLCGRYVDSTFVPGQRAYYYARVLENPSCRWSTWRCVEQGVRCADLDPATGTFLGKDAGYEGCCSIRREGLTYVGTDRFDTIEERAITSPVWY